ncbi:MAG: hypothetical protein XU14_C0046G0006 [Armatimonadetes bacterium CSP1-3]|nr:MAG: hypothetical protein XU14_C0046G0006 [Armatimonadetes bacterium CSP1-3]
MIGAAVCIVLPLTAFSLKVFEVPRHHEAVASLSLILVYLLLLSPLLGLLAR